MTQGSEKRIRSRHLTIRFSPEERATLDAAAERAGLTPGSYARQVIMGAPTPRQIRRPPIERAALARLLGQLGHIGGNLNQLAHHANAGMPISRGEVAGTLKGLGEVRDAILTALGRAP